VLTGPDGPSASTFLLAPAGCILGVGATDTAIPFSRTSEHRLHAVVVGENCHPTRSWSIVRFLLLSGHSWFRMTLCDARPPEPERTLKDAGCV